MTVHTASDTIGHVIAISKNIKKGIDVSIIRDLREEADLTAFDLAAKAGVSLSSINRMETGKAVVTRRIARKVFGALSEVLNRPITVEVVTDVKVK